MPEDHGELTVAHQPSQPLSINELVEHVNLVHSAMKATMRADEHFGLIPGSKKPSLLQPGAQKLSLLFKLAPDYDVIRRPLDNGHIEYEVNCKLTHQGTGNFVGGGVGLCSTMESKYRYRGGAFACPECNSTAIIKGKAEYGGGWLCWVKKGGCGAKFPDDQFSGTPERVENPDLADCYNTVLKMAKKRAFVDAVLTATAASDIFTQDIVEGPAVDDKPQRDVPARPDPTGKHLYIKNAQEPEKYKMLCETLAAMGCRKGHQEDCDAVISYCLKDWTLRYCHGEKRTCDAVMEKLEALQVAGQTGEDIYRAAIKKAGLQSDFEKQGEEVF